MEKRGLSDLIATVLIVLLALAAIAIVWSFLRPPIEGSGRSIGFGTMCLESEIRPTLCVHNTTSDITTLNIQHSRGQGIVDIIVTVDYQDGSSNATRLGTTLDLFASRAVQIPSPSGLNATNAGAAPIVGDGENEEICEESLQTISCQIVI